MAVGNKVFVAINKIKYLMRVKHYKGRAVHSPFMYNIVRNAFMNNKNICVNQPLFDFLKEHNIKHSESYRICRVFEYLGYETYCDDPTNYKGEDLVVVSSDIDIKSILEISEEVKRNKKMVCIVITSIYKNSKRYRYWNILSALSCGAAVDLYHTGFLFLDRYLNKQRYKMRING